MMTIEQKAKRYDEAIERANIAYKDEDRHLKATLERIFPELKESEDERIKRVIRQVLDESTTEKDECYSNNRVTQQEVFAWLEKQGEQKPAWSEEDDEMLDSIIEEVRYIGDFPDYPTKEEDELYDECLAKVEWLKSLKDRVQPQSKQEWSEEDDQYLLVCKNALAKYQTTDKWDASVIYRWLVKKLKSLRPQWKPNEEMLEALYRAIPKNVMEISEDEMLLDKLYQGLKYGRVLSEK